VMDFAFHAVVVGAAILGLVTAARWAFTPRLPDVGWRCVEIILSESTGQQRSSRCEPQQDWHAERWPDGVVHAVPDRAPVVRRYTVRD
jgi:hypothetical protein